MKIKTKTNTHHNIAITSVVIALILTLGATAYWMNSNNIGPFSDSSKDSSPEIRQANDVDYGPPSEGEVNNSQNAKNRILEEDIQDNDDSSLESKTPSNSAKKKLATISISYADIFENNLEIRAFTPSVIEGTGECTATVSKSGSTTITKKTPAFIDASSTICRPIYIPKSQLSTGVWTVNVNYSSPAYEGSSGPMKIEV